MGRTFFKKTETVVLLEMGYPQIWKIST